MSVEQFQRDSDLDDEEVARQFLVRNLLVRGKVTEAQQEWERLGRLLKGERTILTQLLVGTTERQMRFASGKREQAMFAIAGKVMNRCTR